MHLDRKEEAEGILAFITKDMKFEANRETYLNMPRMFKNWVSPEDIEAQRNMPDRKDKFTRPYAISNYYYVIEDLDSLSHVIDRILDEVGSKWRMVFGYLVAVVDRKIRSSTQYYLSDKT